MILDRKPHISPVPTGWHVYYLHAGSFKPRHIFVHHDYGFSALVAWIEAIYFTHYHGRLS